MKGAIIFLAAFFLFLVITLGYLDLPPGRSIYDAVVGAQSDYEILGIPATTLSIAVFNGVVYAVIVYLVYWLADRFIFSRPKTAAEVKTT